MSNVLECNCTDHTTRALGFSKLLPPQWSLDLLHNQGVRYEISGKGFTVVRGLVNVTAEWSAHPMAGVLWVLWL